jgi:excinuclease ABC subunit B
MPPWPSFRSAPGRGQAVVDLADVDLALDRMDVGDGGEVEIAPPDEGLQLLARNASPGAGRRRGAGLDEGRPLPVLADALVVVQRRRPPARPAGVGDQPTAIAELVEGVSRDERDQVLLGVTGSGKTFTMAKVIEATQRPALILAPNKTLAAQLYGEFKSFFPDNAVEYFVSYYDYYQPEAYVPRTDTYIEKESSINEQIDRMRHSATRALLERDDVIIVASVSCIYGIGSVETYTAMTFSLKVGEKHRPAPADRRSGRAAIQAQRRRFQRGTFRVRGDTSRSSRPTTRTAPGASLFGDEIESIDEFDPLTGRRPDELEFVKVYANSATM